MKKFNKVVSLALASTMALSLAACGDTAASTSTSTETSVAESTSETTTDATASDKVHINVYRALFNNGSVDDAAVKKVEDAINAYIGDKIGVEISLTEVGSGEYTEKANLALNNKEINLLWTASWESTIGTKDLVPKNSVYDLTDLLPGTDLYNSMDETQWEASKYDGKNYYIPVYKDNVEGYDFMFRQDLVDKYNWDINSVKTLADLEPMLADAKAEGLKYPFLTQKTAMFYRWYIDSFDFFTGDATSNWVAVDRDTDEVVDVVTSPEYLEFCTLMAKWADEGYISEDDANKVTTDTTTQTQDWAVSWWTDVPNNDEADGRYLQDVTMVQASQRYLHTDSMLGSCYCVTANSTEEEAKACIDFVGLLYTDSYLADLYTYGIEGENYNYDENGYVVKVDGTAYNHSMWESASATAVTCEASSPYTGDMYKEFNGSALISCANGFHADWSSDADLNAKYTACQSVFNEFGFMLENGGYSEAQVADKIAEYQTKLDGAGYQDVLAAFQQQYNDWKATK